MNCDGDQKTGNQDREAIRKLVKISLDKEIVAMQ